MSNRNIRLLSTNGINLQVVVKALPIVLLTSVMDTGGLSGFFVWISKQISCLLAAQAVGCRAHLQVEAGFEREMSLSSLSGNNETAIDATLVSMEDELIRAKHTRQKMDDAVDVVVKLIKQKKEAKEMK